MKTTLLTGLGLVCMLVAVIALWLPVPDAVSAAPSVSPVFTVTVGANNTLTFSPTNTSIPLNSTVRWVWASGFHSTTSGTCSGSCTSNGKWDSGQHSPAFTFSDSSTFTTTGTFNYYCSVHGSIMQGTISVAPTAVDLVSLRADSESPLDADAPETRYAIALLSGSAALALLVLARRVAMKLKM